MRKFWMVIAQECLNPHVQPAGKRYNLKAEAQQRASTLARDSGVAMVLLEGVEVYTPVTVVKTVLW